MTFEAGLTFEHDSFSTLGPTPKFEAWVNARRSDQMQREGFRKGISIAFGIRPIRFAWRGVWKIHPKTMS